MNYELRNPFNPGSVFGNAIRIFISDRIYCRRAEGFFILPNPNIRITLWWQKILATFLFTVVYAVVVSAVLTLIAWLYNLWAASFSGVKFHFEQTEE